MLTQHIALVPETYGMNASELARVSAALQKQVTRDLAPYWGVTATVDAFPKLDDVPTGYLPIVLTFQPLHGQGGMRLDHNGRAYAHLEVTPLWSLHASHACIEMLINPYGLRTVATRSPRQDQGPVELLVEACAPCQDPRYGYTVNGVLVSDFCTPAYFGEASRESRYSFCGSVDAAFQVLPGGHITFRDVATDRFWRKSYQDDCELDLELDREGLRPRLGAPRSLDVGGAVAESRLIGAHERENLVHLEREQHQVALASQATAQRLRAELLAPERSDEPRSDSRHFELLMEAIHHEQAPREVPTTQRPASVSSVPTSPEISIPPRPMSTLPPPLPTASSQAAPSQTTPPQAAPFSSPPLTSSPFLSSPPPTPPASRGIGFLVAGGLAALALTVVALQGRDLLKPERATTPPAYASEPTLVVEPAKATPAAITQAPTVEAVAEVPAPPVSPQDSTDSEPNDSSSTDSASRDEEQEARRARRRELRRLSQAAELPQATQPPEPQGAKATPAVSADPFDLLITTRE